MDRELTAMTDIKVGTLSVVTVVSNTWTPSLTFGGISVEITLSTATGNYYKMNGLVWIDVVVVIYTYGSPAGVAAVAGLPFAVTNTATGTLGMQNVTIVANTYPFGIINVVDRDILFD